MLKRKKFFIYALALSLILWQGVSVTRVKAAETVLDTNIYQTADVRLQDDFYTAINKDWIKNTQMKDSNLNVIKMERSMIDEWVDLYMNTFSKEPWYDEYESKEQVVKYFKSFFDNNYFCGYVGVLDNRIVAISVGMKKPWINGIEYYIDEFCVDYNMLGKGIGSSFIKGIEEDISKQGMNGMILNTEKDFPSYNFYIKNGFKGIDNLVVLGK